MLLFFREDERGIFLGLKRNGEWELKSEEEWRICSLLILNMKPEGEFPEPQHDSEGLRTGVMSLSSLLITRENV